MTDRPNAMRLTRLTQRAQFLAAAGKGRRFRASAFTAQVRDQDEAEIAQPVGWTPLRLGLTASRHVGNAPVRNRIRRRLRAAAQEALKDVSGQPVDLVLVARRDVLSLPFARLKSDIADSLLRARKLAGAKPSAHKNPSNAPNGATAPVQPARKR